MCHWLSPDTPVRVSSFGGLQHFGKSRKPLEAGGCYTLLGQHIRKAVSVQREEGRVRVTASCFGQPYAWKKGVISYNIFVQFIRTELPRVTPAGR